ncbi:hypothetical protein [Caldicellulosiruptor acetigenus]|nr:hypothetical protein [Caldicellulosiruptor acetigenus]
MKAAFSKEKMEDGVALLLLAMMKKEIKKRNSFMAEQGKKWLIK